MKLILKNGQTDLMDCGVLLRALNPICIFFLDREIDINMMLYMAAMRLCRTSSVRMSDFIDLVRSFRHDVVIDVDAEDDMEGPVDVDVEDDMEGMVDDSVEKKMDDVRMHLCTLELSIRAFDRDRSMIISDSRVFEEYNIENEEQQSMFDALKSFCSEHNIAIDVKSGVRYFLNSDNTDIFEIQTPLPPHGQSRNAQQAFRDARVGFRTAYRRRLVQMSHDVLRVAANLINPT
jgi:hypothetical protein